MIRSRSIDVTAAAGAEHVEDFLSGLEGKVRRVTEIWCEQHADGILRGYLESDQIVDVSGECDQLLDHGVPVDLLVPVGKTFKAGWQDNAAAGIVGFITVFYSEE